MQYPMPQGAPPPWPQQPVAAWQQSKDDSDLRTLAILHYVYAGIVGLTSLFFLLYIVIGVVMGGAIAASATSHGGSGPPPGAGILIGGIFAVFGGIFFLLTAAKAVFTLLAGRGLAQRRSYTLAFVVACISCINVPLGTALGIFTIMVLNRPSVKAQFGQT